MLRIKPRLAMFKASVLLNVLLLQPTYTEFEISEKEKTGTVCMDVCDNTILLSLGIVWFGQAPGLTLIFCPEANGCVWGERTILFILSHTGFFLISVSNTKATGTGPDQQYLALHTAGLTSIPETPYGSLIPSRNDY